jgi:hypothetical protein
MEMTALTLESLGLSKEEITERLIAKMADEILRTVNADEDGHPWPADTAVTRRLQDMVSKRLDEFVSTVGEERLLPLINGMVENLVLQTTNKWGEKTGAPVTFTEYMVKKAEEWITEKVNYEGKSQSDAGGYSWSGTQTRVAHMIHKHLHYQIETAMKQALADANNAIAKGLHETVRLKINEVTAKLKVEVKTS